MRNLLVPAAAIMIGALVPQVHAAPIAAVPVVDTASTIVEVAFCKPGKHLGPLLRCRHNTAPALFSYRKPCLPGFRRNFLGLCRRVR